MTDVASRHFVSQSALSNSLLRMENELGTRIFDRVGRNLVLNESGRVYLSHIETALKAIEEGKHALEVLKGTRQQTVSVAMSTTLHFGDLVSRFLQLHPQFSFNQHRYSPDESECPLDVDFIIASDDDPSPDRMECAVFREDRIWLRVPPGNPLAQRESIRLIEAKGEKFINPPKTASFAHFTEKLFELAGFKPNIIAECDPDMQQRLLRRDMGVILLPGTVVQSNFFSYGTDILIEDDFATRRHCLYWSKDRPLTPAAEAFRSFLLSTPSEGGSV